MSSPGLRVLATWMASNGCCSQQTTAVYNVACHLVAAVALNCRCDTRSPIPRLTVLSISGRIPTPNLAKLAIAS